MMKKVALVGLIFIFIGLCVDKREKIIRKDIITEKHNSLLLCSFVLDIYK